MLKKLILYFGLLLSGTLSFAQDFPEKSTTLVTDYTNTLSADDKAKLESKLVAFSDSTSTQIAVVIMKSVGSHDINQYAALLGRKWGVGSKDKNNGIVVLVAVSDRKVAIQTGYGAEGAVPDGVTHDIIANDVTPRFKAGDYFGGLDAATDQLIHYMKGEYKANPQTAAKDQDSGSGGGGIPAGFIIIVVIIILIIIFRRGGGSGGQIIGGRGGSSPFWWFLAGSALGRSSGGGWGGFSGGGGGSSGGGGFGGFGGGSFGGGGSSGSW